MIAFFYRVYRYTSVCMYIHRHAHCTHGYRTACSLKLTQVLVEENSDLRRQLSLGKQTEEELARRNNVYQKTIKSLVRSGVMCSSGGAAPRAGLQRGQKWIVHRSKLGRSVVVLRSDSVLVRSTPCVLTFLAALHCPQLGKLKEQGGEQERSGTLIKVGAPPCSPCM